MSEWVGAVLQRSKGSNEQSGGEPMIHQKSSGKISNLVRLFAAPYPLLFVVPHTRILL